MTECSASDPGAGSSQGGCRPCGRPSRSRRVAPAVPVLSEAAPARAAAPRAAQRAEPRRASSRAEKRRSEEYYQTKSMIFGALIEAIDLAQLVAPRGRSRARGDPRHRQRDHRAQERRDVDRRAGGAARRHLQRRARLRPARAAAGARRHRRHHGERRRQDLHRGQRQDPAHQCPLPRQPAADEHLPADRQPGRPPRRRILADLRRAPARRLARQRHRAAARDRRARAHHPQVQEGQAHPRPARQVRLDLAGGRDDPARSSAGCAATSWSRAAPAPARRRCSTA